MPETTVDTIRRGADTCRDLADRRTGLIDPDDLRALAAVLDAAAEREEQHQSAYAATATLRARLLAKADPEPGDEAWLAAQVARVVLGEADGDG